MALNLPPIGGSGGGAHTQPSLPSLPSHLQSDTHLTAHLASRFHVSLPTARLSSHALICLNTYTSSSKNDGTKDSCAMTAAEDLADRAFIRLGHRSENQAILFLYVMKFVVIAKTLWFTNSDASGVNPARARQPYDLTFSHRSSIDLQLPCQTKSPSPPSSLTHSPRPRRPQHPRPPRPVFSTSCNTTQHPPPTPY